MERSVNFAKVVQEIEAAYGLDDVQLAEKMQVNRTTISRLRVGAAKSPAYELGARLVRLHDDKPNLKRAKR